MKWVLILLTSFLLSCDVNVHKGFYSRSGSIQDDYIEEPLREKKYKDALLLSNKLTELVIAKNTDQIMPYVEERSRPRFNLSELTKLVEDQEQRYGKFVEYKPNQWGFVTRETAISLTSNTKIDVIVSVKIIKFEKGEVHYFFTFKDEPPYDKIMGFTWRNRSGVRQPHFLP